MKKKYWILTIILILVLIFLISISHVFYPSDINSEDWSSYYRLPNDTIDLLFLGSSHSYSTFAPPIFNEILKIDSYCLGAGHMTVEQAYYFLEEAFKTQQPKLVVMEAFCFKDYNIEQYSEVPVHFAFDTMRISKTKINAIQYNVPDKNKRLEFYIPFIKYHTNWKVKDTYLNIKDIFYKSNIQDYFGFDTYQDIYTGEVEDDFWTLPKDIKKKSIEPNRMDMIEKIITICEKNKAQLMIVASPFIIQNKYSYLDQYANLSYLEDYFTSKNIVVYNYNFFKDQIDFQSTDLANQGHVNIKCAKKISEHFADYLSLNYAHIFDNSTYDLLDQTQKYNIQLEKEYQDFLTQNIKLLENYNK